MLVVGALIVGFMFGGPIGMIICLLAVLALKK